MRESSLRREIGVTLGALIVLNATIGTGIFKKPARIAQLTGSLPASLAVWLVGGVIALCGALSLAELAAAMPRTGGLYEVLRRAYGPGVAFFFGWAKLTLLIPSSVGSFARLAAEALTSLLGIDPRHAEAPYLAMGFLAGCVLANLAGIRTNARVQGAITVAKYVGVLGLAGVGLLVSAHGAVPVPAHPPPTAHSLSWTGCFTALVSVMWAYDGWADLSSVAGEVKTPSKTLPRALVAGTAAIVLVYLAANLGYARALGLDGLQRSTTGSNMAAMNAVTLTLGAHGRAALGALVLLSCVGGCMSSLLTGSRVFVPMATDGVFFAGVGALSPRTAVPSRAVVLAGALGAMYVSSRSFEQLTDAFVVGYFPFYMAAVAAVPRLRRTEPAMERPFRVPWHPMPEVVFLLGAAALLWGAMADVDRTALFAFGVMALGIPVYLGYFRRRATPVASR